MKNRTIKGVGVIKHDKVDNIDGQRMVTIHCRFFNNDQKVIASDNLNFTLEEEKYHELKELLGLNELSRKTPVRIQLSIAENNIEEWADLAGVDIGDKKQPTMDVSLEDKEKKK